MLVGTAKGVVIALDSASGREMWRSTLSSEVSTFSAFPDKKLYETTSRVRLRCGFKLHEAKLVFTSQLV